MIPPDLDSKIFELHSHPLKGAHIWLPKSFHISILRDDPTFRDDKMRGDCFCDHEPVNTKKGTIIIHEIELSSFCASKKRFGFFHSCF